MNGYTKLWTLSWSLNQFTCHSTSATEAPSLVSLKTTSPSSAAHYPACTPPMP